jgi:transposase
MPFSYKEWLENFLFPTLKRQGINVTLENDGSIVCEKNGYSQVTPKEAAYSKYEEYLAKYPE